MLTKPVWTSFGLFLVLILAFVLGLHKTMSLVMDEVYVWHEAAGLLLGLGMAAHMAFYRNMIRQSVAKYVQVNAKHKLFVLLFILILIMIVLTLVSGVMISPHLGFGRMDSHWRMVHHVAPKIALGLVLLHVIMRFKKIRSMFKKP